jgi:hypothetical protein
MQVPINVKSPNISKWQMGFNSAFKGLILLSVFLPRLHNIILQFIYFAVGSGREMMSSDAGAAFVAIALALCLIHEKNRR